MVGELPVADPTRFSTECVGGEDNWAMGSAGMTLYISHKTERQALRITDKKFEITSDKEAVYTKRRQLFSKPNSRTLSLRDLFLYLQWRVEKSGLYRPVLRFIAVYFSWISTLYRQTP